MKKPFAPIVPPSDERLPPPKGSPDLVGDFGITHCINVWIHPIVAPREWRMQRSGLTLEQIYARGADGKFTYAPTQAAFEYALQRTPYTDDVRNAAIERFVESRLEREGPSR